MKNLKKLKFTNKLKYIGPKLKWFLFTELQDYKLTSEYIDFICPDNKPSGDPVSELSNIVRQTLIREFSPEIQNTRAFELLVDSVAYKIQKKYIEQI